MDARRYHGLSREKQWLAWVVGHAASSPSSAVVGRTAARVVGMPLNGRERNPQVELAGESRSGAGRRKTVLYRSLPDHLRDRVLAYPTQFGTVHLTHPAQTGIDLARWHTLEDAVLGLDHGLRQGWFNEGDLERLLRWAGPLPRIGRSRRAVALATPFSESPRESALKVAMWRKGLPAPYQQAVIYDSYGEDIGRIDFFFGDVGLGVEYDGRGKYEGEFGEAPDSVRRREMHRQKRLLREGVVLVRIDQDSFRDGSGVREVCRMYEHLVRQNYTIPDRQWEAGGLAWH